MARLRRLAASLVLTVTVASCAWTPAPSLPPAPDGLVAERAHADRQLDHLKAVTKRIAPQSVDAQIAGVALADRQQGRGFDPGRITVDDLAPALAKVDAWVDTSDFDHMRLWTLWHTGGDRLSPPVRDALRQRIVDYRYWYTDPLPAGRVDHKWFWSENHRIIAHVLEHLAGRDLPQERFTVSGELGAVHRDRGRQRITRWLDEKTRWGFSEWHSDVYYVEDLEALLLLAEFGDDDLAARAAAMIDVLLHDLAAHQFEGSMGSTHGRSYMKNKARAETQGVRPTIDLLFGDDRSAEQPDFLAVLFARATRYRPPEAIVRIARDRATMTDIETTGVPLGELGTFGLGGAPEGTSFTDPEQLAFWWDSGAMTAWQVVPLSLRTIREHQLTDTDLFRPLAPLLDRRDLSSSVGAQYAAYALSCQINAGLLARRTTVTHRTATGMLSSVQDFRPGCLGRQYHPWQATLGGDAIVFTTHPANADRGQWADDDLYWNGGVMPRVAQSEGTLIAIHSPGYQPGDAADHLPLTHAYFPTERFDEVRQVGRWTFGRRGDGYVALYSHREVTFAEPGPNPAGLTKSYDLIAAGGPDNVWITELGDRGRWGNFNAFIDAHTAADIKVTALRPHDNGLTGGFDVAYASPERGRIEFGSERPFTVGGAEIDMHPEVRLSSPYAQVKPGESVFTFTIGDARWTADLATGRRGPG